MEILPYELVANTFMVLFAFTGVFLTIYNAIKAIRDLSKPHTDHIEMVKDHEERLKNSEDCMQEIKGGNHILLEAMILLLDHSIYGNHTEDLKERKDFIIRYLAGRD